MPSGDAVLSPGRGAVHKTDSWFALAFVVFLDPLHEDLDLIAVGGAERIVIGVFGWAAFFTEDLRGVGALKPGDLLLHIDLFDQRLETAGDVSGGHDEFVPAVLGGVLVEIGHFHGGVVTKVFQKPGDLLAVDTAALAVDPVHAVDVSPAELGQGAHRAAHGKLGKNLDFLGRHRTRANKHKGRIMQMMKIVLFFMSPPPFWVSKGESPIGGALGSPLSRLFYPAIREEAGHNLPSLQRKLGKAHPANFF